MTTPASSAALVVDGLTRRYGSRTVVDHLSFTVPRGTVCGFIGPNGSGKTTTICMLLGLIETTEGTATVLGEPIDHPARYLPRVGAMIEGPAFHPTLSARRNLEVLARLGGLPLSRIDEVLAQVDLADRGVDLYRGFSLGMKQRLGIAAALLPNPELLILDEPTNGLDPDGIREIRGLLRGLADRGMTVFVSSHLLDELQQICDHVVLITNGQLRFQGPIGDLLIGHGTTIRLRAEDPSQTTFVMDAVHGLGLPARVSDDVVTVQASPDMAATINRAVFASGATLSELQVHQPRLEEVFFELTAASR